MMLIFLLLRWSHWRIDEKEINNNKEEIKDEVILSFGFQVVNLLGIDFEPRPKILALESGNRPRFVRACKVTTGKLSLTPTLTSMG